MTPYLELHPRIRLLGLRSRLVIEATLSKELPVVLDLDGTITDYPEFFSIFSKMWPFKVYIVTYREDKVKAELDAKRYGIEYDDLICVNKLDGKAAEVKRLGAKAIFDDMDECLYNIPDDVLVLKVRNGGNFEDGKWLYSSDTGLLL